MNLLVEVLSNGLCLSYWYHDSIQEAGSAVYGFLQGNRMEKVSVALRPCIDGAAWREWSRDQGTPLQQVTLHTCVQATVIQDKTHDTYLYLDSLI